ncbi:MAG: NAD(P)-dependent oxidoreductase [bacterium]|nr:NAD(P)-dependent oxidoreductase [bacterium]
MSTIGLVGLGLVGKAVAGRLTAAGHDVIGCDTVESARDAARGMGVHVVDSPSRVMAECGTVLLSLPDSAAVTQVLWGPGGLAETVRPNVTVVDTTTTRPSETVEHGRRLGEKGVRFVDAALVGSSREIEAGEAVALVGDTEEAADYAPLLRLFSKRVVFFGQCGQGHRAKLVVNLVLGLNRLVLAEGLSLAEASGLDARHVLDMLKGSAAYSRVMDVKGDRMLTGDFEPAARLAQHAKDVGLILELAGESGAAVPASELHASILQHAIDAGWGALDNSAVINVYREDGEGDGR